MFKSSQAKPVYTAGNRQIALKSMEVPLTEDQNFENYVEFHFEGQRFPHRMFVNAPRLTKCIVENQEQTIANLQKSIDKEKSRMKGIALRILSIYMEDSADSIKTLVTNCFIQSCYEYVPNEEIVQGNKYYRITVGENEYAYQDVDLLEQSGNDIAAAVTLCEEHLHNFEKCVYYQIGLLVRQYNTGQKGNVLQSLKEKNGEWYLNIVMDPRAICLPYKTKPEDEAIYFQNYFSQFIFQKDPIELENEFGPILGLHPAPTQWQSKFALVMERPTVEAAEPEEEAQF